MFVLENEKLKIQSKQQISNKISTKWQEVRNILINIINNTLTLFKEAKARTTIIKLISSAKTGYIRTLTRPRTCPAVSQVRYDPIGMNSFIFLVICVMANTFTF